MTAGIDGALIDKLRGDIDKYNSPPYTIDGVQYMNPFELSRLKYEQYILKYLTGVPNPPGYPAVDPRYAIDPVDKGLSDLTDLIQKRMAVFFGVPPAKAKDVLFGIALGQAMFKPLGIPGLIGGGLLGALAGETAYLQGHHEPLVFDLGSGIQTTTLDDGTYFDNKNNGFEEATAWVGANTGILVYDPSGGPITNGSQEFGTSTSLSGGGYAVDGFSALAALDSNDDGVINSSDADWSDLRIWVGGDGNPGSGTLETMAEAGIASIGLTTTNIDTTDANGNYISKTSAYSLVGGGTAEVADVSFQIDPTETIADNYVSVSDTIAALPDIYGSGTVYDLQQAMQIQADDGDTTLETYVQDFVAATDDVTRNTLVDEIIYQWTGVEDVSTSARGSYFNAQQLEAMEQFTGYSFIDPYNDASDPSQQSAVALTVIYQQTHSFVLAELEAQTNLASFFNDIQFAEDPTTDLIYNDFSAAENEILSDLSANRGAGLAILTDFNQALHALGLDQGEGFQVFQSDLIAHGLEFTGYWEYPLEMNDVAKTFIDGTPIVYGTVGPDVITAWAGNQIIMAGQGGNDTLMGGTDDSSLFISHGGDNETFYGSGNGDLFIGGVGNNEVFYGGDNDDGAIGGIAGTSDTFIAGQGTQTFLENAYGRATIYYTAGDGNLTVDNFVFLSSFNSYDQGNELILDSSIARSDVSLGISGYGFTITDSVSGDLVTISNHNLSTLEFADGTTIDLQTFGGIQKTTSGSSYSNSSLDYIYSYNSGTGDVTLNDTGGNNQLWLGSGITASDISYASSGNNLLITDDVSGDQITDINRSIQTMVFADGTTANLFAAGNTYTLSGSTTATGSALNDTYAFASGTGSATISDPGGQNTLLFGSGITSSDLTFTASGADLLITDGVSGDQIDIQSEIGGNPSIQTAEFSDASTINLTGLTLNEASGDSFMSSTTGNDTLIGNSGSQTLYGSGGNDAFVVGVGNTTIEGGKGSAIVSYASGSGDLTIEQTNGQGTIVLGSGISTSDVSLVASGNDLLITDGISGDQITIDSQLGPQSVVSSLVFTDGGTTENLDNIALTMPSGAAVLNGTLGDDTLTATSGTQTLISNGGNTTFVGASGTESLLGNGYAGSNTFIIGAGVTTAWGGAGDDAYSYASGDGQLTIYDGGGQNSIVLASGLTASDITLTASGDNLLITDGVSGDQITLEDQLSTNVQIQDIVFSDESTESLESGLTLTVPSGVNGVSGPAGDGNTLIGTSGTQTLLGDGGNDTFITGMGTMTVIGNSGNDNISYAAGDGDLIVEENSGTNVISFASGITAADISWAISGMSDMVLTDGTSGDQITIDDQFSPGLGITSLVFSGGTSESLQGLDLTMPSGASTLNGTAGSDTLNATAGTEVMNGNGGNDTFIMAAGNITANGGGGNDLYSYSSGYGFLTINELGGNDTLQLGSGLTASNISLSESSNGNDLLITDGVTGDKITIAGDLSLGANEFGTVIYGDATTASLVNNVTLYAQSGTSTLNGTQGNDTYSYSAGDGNLLILNTAGTSTLKLGSGLTTSNVSMAIESDLANKDLVITDSTTGDQITVHDFNIVADQVDSIVYGDGTTASLIEGVLETAAAGTTTLWGTAGGNDTLIGGAGTMDLIGNEAGNGNELMVAGVGATTAWGGTGNDTYSYASGDGAFYIDDLGGTDTLKLGSGLTQSNVKMSIVSNLAHDNLVITDGVSGDQITIDDFDTTADQLETIVYGDGTTASLVSGVLETAAAGTTTLWGTAGGSDTLIGNTGTMNLIGNEAGNGNELMVAGVGTTAAWGGTGNDTYSYASGDGAFYIEDQGGTDTLKLGTGLTLSNVRMTMVSDLARHNLVITDGVSGDQITINDFDLSADQLETIVYGDGTTASLVSGVLETAANGTATLWGTAAGNDTLIGGTGTNSLIGNEAGNGNELMVAGAGQTSAFGGTGNDVYSYNSGDGTFFIEDVGGTNTLKLGSGLTQANVTMTWEPAGIHPDLYIYDSTSGDVIHIYDTTSSSAVQTIVYGDGTTASLVNGVDETATAGTSTLEGTSGNDTLIGGTGTMSLIGNYTYGGNDIMVSGVGSTTAWGGNGNDTYSYNSGDGVFSIIDTGGTNTLKLGSGLTASNLTFSEDSSGQNMEITDGVSGDEISIFGQASYPDYQIQTLVFSDSSTMDLTSNLTLNAQIGNSTLVGLGGNSKLIAVAGTSGDTETLEGNSGNDTYVYAPGDGAVYINEQGDGGTDTLDMTGGITADQLSVSTSGNNVTLDVNGSSSDKVTIYNQLSSNAGYHVENIVFDDGFSANLSNVSSWIFGTSTASTLSGTSGNDVIISVGANDTINGGDGNDAVYGGTGNDSIVEGNGNNLIYGGTSNDTINAGTGSDTMVGGAGADVYVVNNTSDVVSETTGGSGALVESSVNWTLGANINQLQLTATSLVGKGNTNADVLSDGGVGSDTLVGNSTSGNDTFVVSNSSDVVSESTSGGAALIETSVNFDLATNATNVNKLTLEGTAALSVTGNSSADTIVGNTGNDTITVNSSSVTLQSGTADVVTGNGNTITAIGGNDTITVGTSDGLTLTGSNTVIGASGATLTSDAITFDSNSLAGTFTSTVASGSLTYTLSGTTLTVADGSDVLTDNNFTNGQFGITVNPDEVISGGSGDATLSDGGAGNGNYTLIGNSTNGGDEFVVNNTGDSVTEANGGGTALVLSSVNWTMGSHVDHLTFTGSSALVGTGNTDADVLTSNAGADTLVGNSMAGNDTFVVNNTGDTLTEANSGTAATVTSGVNWTLGTHFEKLTLTGSSSLTGTGNSGTNILTGNTGNDVLIAGSGIASLIGDSSTGSDTFVINNTGDTVTETNSGTTGLVESSINWMLGSNLEQLTLTGSSNLTGTGNGLTDTIIGNTGNDFLVAGSGVATIIGNSSSGVDTFVVNNTSDSVTEINGGTAALVQSSVNWTLGTHFEDLTLTGSVALKGIGNTSTDILSSNSGADTLVGNSSGGNDTFVVYNTADSLTEANSGTAALVQSNVNWTLGTHFENLTLEGSSNLTGTGNSSVNVITGNTGNDILAAGTGNATMIGNSSAGADTFLINNTNDSLTEVNSGTAALVQSSVNWTLGTNFERLTLTGSSALKGVGNASNDILTSNTGADTLAGNSTSGNDTFVVNNTGDSLTETNSGTTALVDSSVNWTLGTYFEQLTLTGSSALKGVGNTSSDILTSNSGVDTLVGNSTGGNDTFVVNNTGDSLTETNSGTAALVVSSVNWSLSGSSHFENLTLTGSSNLTGTGNTGSNIITGNTGNDVLNDGRGGSDTLIGNSSSGNDTFYVYSTHDSVTETNSGTAGTVDSTVNWTLGSNLRDLVLNDNFPGTGLTGIGNNLGDSITGGMWSDFLEGGSGNDTLIGGTGSSDTIIGGAGNNYLEGGTGGNDEVSYASSSSGEDINLVAGTATSSSGNDTLIGFQKVVGSSYNDTITDSGTAADTMIGGGGNDTFFVNNMGDSITESSGGTAVLVEAGVSFSLAANIQNLTLTGSSNLTGTGNTGSNIITGNTGNDVLKDGQGGSDTLIGNSSSGSDTFYVYSTHDSVTETNSGTAGTVDSTVSWTLGSNLNVLVLNSNYSGLNLTGRGNSGNDILSDGGSSGPTDVLIGNNTSGDDTFIVNHTGDSITETNSGATATISTSVNWTLGTHFEDLILMAASLKGIGNSGNDVLTDVGSAGSDTLIGNSSSGADTFVINNTSDSVTETNSGTSALIKSSVNWTLGTHFEELTLTASNITGTLNNSTDTITDNSASGGDTLVGGTGADDFVLISAGVYNNSDTLNNFSTTNSDKIDISSLMSAAGYVSGVSTLADFVQAVNSGSNSLLQIDTTGTGSHFQTVATITGVTGVNVATYVSNGNLIV
jgi:Ca2+-binding RTX toxin-like protein